MVDFVPIVVVIVGFVAVMRPEWIAAIDRRQRTAGTTRRSADVEMNDTYYAFVRVFGLLLTLVGLVLLIGSFVNQ